MSDKRFLLLSAFFPEPVTFFCFVLKARKLFKLLLEHGDRRSLVDHVTILDPLPDAPVFTVVNRMLNSLKLFDGLSLSQV